MKKAAKSSVREGGGRKTPSKPYWEMTTAELREATKEFDREFISDTFGPPSAEQRAQDRLRSSQTGSAPQRPGGQDHLRHRRETLAGSNGSAGQETPCPPRRSRCPRVASGGQQRSAGWIMRRAECCCGDVD